MYLLLEYFHFILQRREYHWY